jgi:hypothetical protein
MNLLGTPEKQEHRQAARSLSAAASGGESPQAHVRANLMVVPVIRSKTGSPITSATTAASGQPRWVFDENDTVLWAAGEMAEAIATTDPRCVLGISELRRHRRRSLSTSGMNDARRQELTELGMRWWQQRAGKSRSWAPTEVRGRSCRGPWHTGTSRPRHCHEAVHSISHTDRQHTSRTPPTPNRGYEQPTHTA